MNPQCLLAHRTPALGQYEGVAANDAVSLAISENCKETLGETIGNNL